MRKKWTQFLLLVWLIIIAVNIWTILFLNKAKEQQLFN